MAESPFDAAYLRVRRGREHLGKLKEWCEEVADCYAAQMEAQLKIPAVLKLHGLLTWLEEQRFPQEHIPTRLPILIGEAVYNFRAALDYLVGALARSDSPASAGSGKRRNQFPIEHSRHRFASRRDTFLAGVSAAHVAVIEGYQPYKGCQWTARLARLSNMDKHNNLVVVLQGLTIRVEPPAEDGAQGKVVLTPQMTVENDCPVIETIEDVAVNVTNILDVFSG